jgi:hypothetical protein
LRKLAERKAGTKSREAAKARERASKLAGRAVEAEGRAAAAAVDAELVSEDRAQEGEGRAAAAAKAEWEKAARIAEERAIESERVVGLEGTGVVYDRDAREWFPGSWKLEIVKSDPVIYRLVIPRDGREVRIELDVEGIQRPATVASAILAATGDMLVDLSPGIWPAAWRGTPAKKKTPGRSGLLAKLMAAKTWVDEEKGLDNRFGRVADVLRDSLLKVHERAGFPADDDEDVPVGIASARGGFHRDNAGKVSLAFHWPTVWAAALAADPSLTESDARKFRRRAADAGVSLGSKVVWVEGRTVRLILLDRRGFELLACMAVE